MIKRHWDEGTLLRGGRFAQSPGAIEKGSRGTIKRHRTGLIDAVLTSVTNARSEAANAKIQ